jgi:LysM repeat protein
MRSGSLPFHSRSFPALAIAARIVTGCLLVGCANEHSAPPQPHALTTGSIAPSASPHPRATVIVMPGDTLYRIARRHHVTVYDLKIANDLTHDRIASGQMLYLPAY